MLIVIKTDLALRTAPSIATVQHRNGTHLLSTFYFVVIKGDEPESNSLLINVNRGH